MTAVIFIALAVYAFIWWQIVPDKCLDCRDRNMNEFACPYNEGYCLWCCYCPDHLEEHQPSENK